MQRRWLVVVVAMAALALARPACAVWVESQLTAKYPDAFWQHFAVTITDNRDHKTKVVTVVVTRPDGKPLPPFFHAELGAISDTAWVASVPVLAVRREKSVEYRFELAPELLAHSRFDIREQGYEQARDDNGRPAVNGRGKPEYEMTLGGYAVWFWLRDFAK